MEDLVVTIARALVEHPDDVHVETQEKEGTVILTLSVHEDDIGKVIGKQGRIANSIRSVVYASAAHQNQRVRLDIAE